MKKTIAVIMAGGFGTRLWPLSQIKVPKQFLKLSGVYSSFQQTLLRNKEFGIPIVIANKAHENLVKKQLTEIKTKAIIMLEPQSKNTAATSIIAALVAQNYGASQVILLPSDHYIRGRKQYLDTINKAITYADHSIVTIGIPPSAPHTGYGYIKMGAEIASDVRQVAEFVEKPDLPRANHYCRHGQYYWNSGIFIYDIQHLLEAARTLQPELFYWTHQAFDNSYKEREVIALNDASYQHIEPISIDHAILHRAQNMKVIKGQFTWNDLGNWQSLWQITKKDRNHNCVDDNVLTQGVKNSYIKSNKKLTAVIGLKNVVIVDTAKALLVASKSQAEQIKKLINSIPPKSCDAK